MWIHTQNRNQSANIVHSLLQQKCFTNMSHSENITRKENSGHVMYKQNHDLEHKQQDVSFKFSKSDSTTKGNETATRPKKHLGLYQ